MLLLVLALLLPAAASSRDPITRIEIETAPVFPDTTEEPLPWILRLANRLHATTREGVIRSEILLEEGAPFDSLRMKESERLLRERGLFERVELRAFLGDSGRVVRARTQDIWTLSVLLSIEKLADLSTLTIGLQDGNLLGTGNRLSWIQSFSNDQDGLQASLTLPRLGATRAALSLGYADFEDARARSGFLGRHPETPFDRFGWAIRAQTGRGRQRFFHDGEEVGTSGYARESLSLFLGRYAGSDPQVGAGVGWAERRLRPSGEPRATAPGFSPPPAFIEARHRGPLLYAGAMRRRFLETRNLDRYGTIEDLPVGWSVSASAGPNLLRREDPQRAFAAWASLAGSWFRTSRLGASLECVAEGFLDRDRRWTERRLIAAGAAVWHPHDRWLAALQGSALVGADRPETAVLYLGTDTGLRGFPARAFETRDYFLATIETRYWTGIEVLWTGIGLNLFTDSALPSPGSLSAGEKWRTGAGCGLLLGLKKSLRRPVRIEVAWRTDAPADPTLTATMSASLRVVPSILLPDPVLRLAEAAR